MSEIILSAVRGMVDAIVGLLTHIGADPKEVVVKMIDAHPLVNKIDQDIDQLVHDTYDVVPDGSSER